MATATASPSVPRGSGLASRRSASSAWRHVDLTLIGAVLAIALLGMLMIYSATRNALEVAGLDPQYYLQRQALWVAVGILAMTAMTVLDYRLYRDFAPLIYAGTVFFLLLVISPVGSARKGTQAWFQLGPYQFQPSEYAKITLVICITAYIAAHRGDIDGRRFLVVLGLSAPPLALIYLQPDLGTALVFLAILIVMLLVGGARPRHLATLVLVGVVAMVAVVQLGVLKQYQLDRLSAFIEPSADTQGSTYNLNQSKTAIGSGGVTGRGLFQGSQTNLSYVPEQHTDFIFTAMGEQLGLIGSALLLALFAVVMWRTWRAAALAKDMTGTLMCAGVLAMLAFQVFENVGMTMGIMPITGIPLPFMSYGGSSTVASFAGVGLVLNVHMRRFT